MDFDYVQVVSCFQFIKIFCGFYHTQNLLMVIWSFILVSFNTTWYKEPKMSQNINYCAHKNYFAWGSVVFAHFHDSFSHCVVSKSRSYKIFAKLLLGCQESVWKVSVLKIFLLIQIKSWYESNLSFVWQL